MMVASVMRMVFVGRTGSEFKVTITLQQLATHVQEADEGAWLCSIEQVKVVPFSQKQLQYFGNAFLTVSQEYGTNLLAYDGCPFLRHLKHFLIRAEDQPTMLTCGR